jgi:hypothetical protein
MAAMNQTILVRPRTVPGAFAHPRAQPGRLILALAVVVAAFGCGGSSASPDAADPSGTVSCTVSLSDGTTLVNRICYEGSGAALRSALDQQCRAQPDASGASTGSFAQAPCSHVGAVGGCLTVAGGVSQAGWYYTVSGITADQVRQLCAGIGATFVAP